MKKNNKSIGRLLIQLGEKIRDGECDLDEEEMEGIFSVMLHRKLNVEQCCQEYGFSRATLYRKIEKGEWPKPKKDPGGKEYFWKDEIEDYIEKN